MSKRRTRKQKENASHNFSVSWKPTDLKSNRSKIGSSVKNQNTIPISVNNSNIDVGNSAKYTDKYFNLASMKRDLIKSLTFASLILASELVLYFIWQ